MFFIYESQEREMENQPDTMKAIADLRKNETYCKGVIVKNFFVILMLPFIFSLRSLTAS